MSGLVQSSGELGTNPNPLFHFVNCAIVTNWLHYCNYMPPRVFPRNVVSEILVEIITSVKTSSLPDGE
ncbi:MAG: hypothetical protein AAF573_07425 [Bacteroidota bacterium]